MPESIHSYWELVEPVFDKIDIGSPEAYFASATSVSRSVLLLYAAHFCLSEIHNGGFLQFFWNSTGVIAPEAASGFSAIGMTELASVITSTAALLGLPYPRGRDERWDALLAASGIDEMGLKNIFEKSSNLYLAFDEATAPLSFDALDQQVWSLAQVENGGFQEAATRYAQSLSSIQ
jgi:hypothetical protein